jgi:hypothetical protein
MKCDLYFTLVEKGALLPVGSPPIVPVIQPGLLIRDQKWISLVQGEITRTKNPSLAPVGNTNRD